MARRRAGTPGRTDWRAARRIRRAALAVAWERFRSDGGERDPRFRRFRRRESAWLDDWCRLGVRRDQTPDQLAFEQFMFDRQWKSLRSHAARCGVRLVGDLPIFVPLESVDVRAHPDLFRLDASGRPTVVTGVPPDAFSRTGQLWNHPHYRWTAHRRTGFDWWIERIARQLRLFDAVRIDHFIGFHRAWEVKAGARDARSGRWGRSPGDELLRAARRRLGPMPLFAEDLGAVTREVIALRDRHGLPGMRILQNAFGSPDSSDLPANHPRHAVVSRHDNAPSGLVANARSGRPPPGRGHRRHRGSGEGAGRRLLPLPCQHRHRAGPGPPGPGVRRPDESPRNPAWQLDMEASPRDAASHPRTQSSHAARGGGSDLRTTSNEWTMNAHDLRSQLNELAMNLWWTWSPPARRLMAGLDPDAWRSNGHDALAVIAGLGGIASGTASCDVFLETLSTGAGFDAARARRFDGRARCGRHAPTSVRSSVCTSPCPYAGGLGILAGDHLRSASDLGIALVGVGIVYHGGYYRQGIEADGSTRVEHPDFDPDASPMRDTGHVIDVPMGDRTVAARVLRMQVGRCPLYLLDADIEANDEADRALSGWLYGGDPDLRMRRQMLLGVGGAMALRAVGETVTVDHLNEGHAAFVCVQRLREAIDAGLGPEEAMDAVRRRTVFTTHTPVPAGHDRYDIDAVTSLLAPITGPAGITDATLAELGREHDQFCMTVLALRCSNHVNGVSRLHGLVTKEMWQDIYGERRREAVPIMHVTNGVHLGAWMHSDAWEFWRRHGIDLESVDPDTDPWKQAESIEPAELWSLRNTLRADFIGEVRRVERARRRAPRSMRPGCSIPRCWPSVRTCATYKQALVFRDPRDGRDPRRSTSRAVDLRRQGPSRRPRRSGLPSSGLRTRRFGCLP